MANAMQIEEFRALAASFGGNLLRWPEDRQVAAHRFAQRADAQAILKAESALDHTLDQAMIDAPSPDFMARLLAVPDQAKAPAALPVIAAQTSVRPTWVLSLAAFAVLGFSVAQFSVATTTEIPAATHAQSTAQDTTQSAVSLDAIVLGPTTLNEVML